MLLLTDLFRSVLIYLHLLLFGVAIALVFWADLRIFRGLMTDDDYSYLGTVILRLFLGLWVTGLTIIYIDTGFDPLVIAEKPKVLTKLLCISVLSLNAVVLHKICLNILMNKSEISRPQAYTLSICGALSTSHWLIAAFVGSAEVLGQFSFQTLASVYAVTLACILLIGISIAPHMHKRFNAQRQVSAIRSRRALHNVDLNLGEVQNTGS